MRFLILTVSLSLFSIGVHAQSKEQLLDQLFELEPVKEMLAGEQMLQPVFVALEKQILGELDKQDPPISEEAKQVLISLFKETFMEEMSLMMEDTLLLARRLYLEVFTKEELEAMVRFYQDPHAISMLEKTPILMGKMMEDLLPRLQELEARFKKNFESKLEKLKERQ